MEIEVPTRRTKQAMRKSRRGAVLVMMDLADVKITGLRDWDLL